MAFNMQPTHVIFLTTQLFLNRTHIYMFGFSLCSNNCLAYHVNVHYALFIPLSIQTYCVCACERPLKCFVEIRRNWLYFVRYTSNILFIAFYRIDRIWDKPHGKMFNFQYPAMLQNILPIFLVYMYLYIINVYMFSLPPPCHFMRQLLICQSIIRRK